MALIASLQFGDNDNGLYTRTYNVCDVKCHTLRPHTKYLPDGAAKCERIEITVVAPGKEDLTLLEWYVNRSAMSGRVLIVMSNEAKLDVLAEKEIRFENAVCFQLSEEYHIDNGFRRLLTLSFQTGNI